jgi:hypothetical protein
LALATVLVLASCGDAADGSPRGSAPAATSGGSGDDADTLAEFFGYSEETFDPAAAEAEARTNELLIQEKVQACMAAEGFEYTPYVPDYGTSFYAGPGGDLTEDEFRERYGYGYFTMMLEEPAFEESFSPEDDPNWVRQEAMSEAERAAYEKALYGDWESFNPELEYDDEGNEIYVEPDFSEIGGCYNLAQEEVWGGGPDSFGRLNEINEELQPAFEDLYRRIEADPRVADANAEWASCMAEKGYTFSSPEDIFEYLNQQQQELFSDLGIFDSANDVEVTVISDEGPFGPGFDEEKARELADEELVIAADDWECQGDLQKLREEVSAEYEAAFIDENRALLEELKSLTPGLGG